MSAVASLDREVHQLNINARQFREMLDRIDDPRKPACKDFRLWLKRDFRRASALVAKLKRAHERAQRDVARRYDYAEQLRVAEAAEAALRAVQIEPGARPDNRAPEGAM